MIHPKKGVPLRGEGIADEWLWAPATGCYTSKEGASLPGIRRDPEVYLMRHNRHGLFLLSLGLLWSASTTIADAQAVEQQVVVSVVDSDGVPVGDLTASDVVVTEDGARREVLSVRRDTEPKQIALLVDTSQAVGPAARNFQEAALAFVESMVEGNEISIISFGGPPRILVEATDDLAQLRDGVGNIVAYSNSASYLLDAVTETVQGFQRRSTPRPVIVVLGTLGVDFSNAEDRGTLESLKEAGVAMHPIVVAQTQIAQFDTGPIARGRGIEQQSDRYRMSREQFTPEPVPGDTLQRDRFLNQSPAQTGGRRRDLLTASSLERAVNDLSAQLRGQYLVVYSRPGILIPPEEIRVAVNRDGLDARGTPVSVESDQ